MEVDDRAAGTESLRVCVVFGGRGFVGRHVVLRLLKTGNWVVRVADSRQSLQLDPSEHESPLSEALSSDHASFVPVDIRHKSQVVSTIEGSSVVYYTDSIASYPDNFFQCYKIIVQGAKNIVNACQECKVKRLIYNSSADVVFDGLHDIHDGDETLPYPWKFDDMLSDLRAQAEAIVLFANDVDGLLTCALRPSNVFGPGDMQLVPFFLNRAQSVWEKFMIGSGENMADFTYVENVAHALICTEESLCSNMAFASGKAFFIANNQPIKFWDFVSLILEGLGYERPLVKVPARIVLCGLSLVKWMHERLGCRTLVNPSSAQRIIRLASHTRTFKCSSAEKHLKYAPIVSMEEGVKFTIGAFSHLTKESFIGFNVQSKADKLLGSGKVADILLWRNENVTFTCFIVVVLLFCWFFLFGRTFITSACELLLLITVGLYGIGLLPSNMFCFNVYRISSCSFQLPETCVKDSSTAILFLLKKGIEIIKAVARGNDWNVFLKVAVFAYTLKMVSSRTLAIVAGTVLVLPFMAFFIYEQCEKEIDRVVNYAGERVENLKAWRGGVCLSG